MKGKVNRKKNVFLDGDSQKEEKEPDASGGHSSEADPNAISRATAVGVIERGSLCKRCSLNES